MRMVLPRKVDFVTKPRTTPSAFCASAALFLSLLIPMRGYPQAVGGTILGTITDPSGAVIPQVQVSIRNVATNVARAATTNADGFYTAPDLLPGEYTITATAPGFSTEVRSGIILTVGAQQVLNLQMKVGTATEKVEVTGAAPAVELASSTMSGLVNATTIVDLPLNGRDWTQLATLEPGVAVVHGQRGQVAQPGSLGGKMARGEGLMVSISGGRPHENVYLLDGININDYANSAPGSALGVNLGVDAVQEFSVLTNTYSAQYGRSSGGVINAVTRAGTNTLHGDVYEFLRNDALDAADFITNSGGIQKSPLRRNQFGAAVGGPIKRDRTFFFADYEGFRQVVGSSTRDIVPTAAARAGDLCSDPGTPPVCTPTSVNVAQAVKPYLPIWPLPNGAILPGGDTGVFSLASPDVQHENYLTARIDQRFSEKDSMDGTYLYDNALDTSPDEFDNKPVPLNSTRQVVSLNENHIFSSQLFNTARVGMSRTVASHGFITSVYNPLLKDPSLGFIPGHAVGIIDLSGAGITGFSGGLGTDSGDGFWYTSIQGYDDLYYTKGIHSIKMGANVERIRENVNSPFKSEGYYSFSSLSDFLTNVPFHFQGEPPGTGDYLGFRSTVFGAYILDDMRLRPNLTLNLNLRYEMASVPTEAHGKTPHLVHLTDPKPTVSPFFKNPTLGNFEPRIGLAWDPFKDGKTSIRAGFGIFDVLPLPYLLHKVVNSAPFAQGGDIFVPPGTFPTGGLPLLVPTTNLAVIFDEAPPRAYKMQWNLNVQRQLTANTTLLVAFVGSRGVHMPLGGKPNFVIPTITPQGAIFPQPPNPNARLNPNMGNFDELFFRSDTFYDGLQLGLSKRLSHGLQAQTSFTWSKGIDYQSGNFNEAEFNNSVANPLDFVDLNPIRAVSDYNIPRNFVLSFIYNIPSPGSWPGPVAQLAKGWQLGGIYTLQDGTPFSARIAGDPAGSFQDADERPDFNSIPGCSTNAINPGNFNNYIKTQCFRPPTPGVIFNIIGRNTMTGPGESNLDFSLSRNFSVQKISENFRVQFRAEAFNMLNRANLAPPSDFNVIFDKRGNLEPSAGQVDALQTTARQIQLALRLVW